LFVVSISAVVLAALDDDFAEWSSAPVVQVTMFPRLADCLVRPNENEFADRCVQLPFTRYDSVYLPLAVVLVTI